MESIQIECPGCGRPVSIDQKKCSCGAPLNIASYNTISSWDASLVNKYANMYKKVLAQNPDNHEANTSAAMCFFKMRLYDKAEPFFEKAIEENFDNADVYFFASLNLLKGKKPFVTPRQNINKIMEYMNAALGIEEKGIYHYFMAYIKDDYFNKKFLNITPTHKDSLLLAVKCGVTEDDVNALFAAMNLPAVFY